MSDSYDAPTDEKEIPCSRLIGPTRITILSKRHSDEIVKDVSEEIWSLLGQSVHYILGKQETANVTTEHRIKVPLNGYVVTGKPDYFDHSIGHLKDFKVTSAYKVVFGKKDGFKSWTEQLNVYAWLLRKTGKKVRNISIVAILRDWQEREAKRSEDYPNIQIQEIPIELWSIEFQEEFISQRLEALTNAEGLIDEELPVCTPDERWMTPTTYAVYKNGNKRAARVLKTRAEAYDYTIKEHITNGRVEERLGEDRRCEQYCSVSSFCSYWKGKQCDQK